MGLMSVTIVLIMVSVYLSFGLFLNRAFVNGGASCRMLLDRAGDVSDHSVGVTVVDFPLA